MVVGAAATQAHAHYGLNGTMEREAAGNHGTGCHPSWIAR